MFEKIKPSIGVIAFPKPPINNFVHRGDCAIAPQVRKMEKLKRTIYHANGSFGEKLTLYVFKVTPRIAILLSKMHLVA